MRIGLGRRPWLNPRLSVSMSRSAKLVLSPGTSMCAHVRVKGWIHNAAAHRVFCHFLSPFGFFQNQKLIFKLLDFDCKNTSESIGCIRQDRKVEKHCEKRPSIRGVQANFTKKESRTHLGLVAPKRATATLIR